MGPLLMATLLLWAGGEHTVCWSQSKKALLIDAKKAYADRRSRQDSGYYKRKIPGVDVDQAVVVFELEKERYHRADVELYSMLPVVIGFLALMYRCVDADNLDR